MFRPNLEKVLYTKLLRFREEQLENYEGPPMEYSISDYHHIPRRPVTRRSSTRVSMQGGNRRQSQYSILDDMPRKSQTYRQASVAGTEESYDPFRTSRTQIDQRQADHARVTVLRGSSTMYRAQRLSGINTKRASLRKTSTRRNATLGSPKDDTYSILKSPSVMRSTNPSQYQKLHNDRRVFSAMSRRSFISVSSGRPAPVYQSMSYKRGVSFVHTHAKKRSVSAQAKPLALKELFIKDRPQQASSLPSLLVKNSPILSTPQIVRSKKTSTTLTAEQLSAVEDPTIPSLYWKDDARKVSNELEKFCDEAFNRSSVTSTAPTAHTVLTGPPERSYGSPATSISVREDSDMPFKHPHRPAQPARQVRLSDLQRPLPKPPIPEPEQIGSSAQRELARTMDLLKQRAADPSMAMAPGCLDDVIAHLERLMQPSTVRANEPRRFVSTPDPSSPALGRSEDTFDRLMERGNIGFRAASEPVKGDYGNSPRRRRYPNKETLRLVQSDEKPISPTKPLTIRKKSGSSSTPTTPSGGSVRTSAEPPPPASRVHARVSGDERRIAGLSQLVDMPLESIDEDKENFDPLPRNPKTLSGDGKKRNWFRRQQQAENTAESPDKGPPPPLKDLTHLQDWRSASPEKRKSDVPSEESHTSEPKKQQAGKGKGKGKFFKIFSKNKPAKPDPTTGGKLPFLRSALPGPLTNP